MRDPFKSMRARSRRKLARATSSTLSNIWNAILAPTERKGSTNSKSTAKASKDLTPKRGSDRKAPTKTATKRLTPATSRAKPGIPRGAKFESGSHVSPFGTRSYRLYVPVIAKTTTDPLPLIVMLHGCGQTPQDFARGTGMNALAEEFGFLVLYPEQSRAAHIRRCWNWFRQGDQGRGNGEPALIADLTQQMIADRNVNPAKVYVAGLSAGACAALLVATAYPDIFAAVGVHSGLSVGVADDAASAARAMQFGDPGQRHDNPVPTIIFHGEDDKVVNVRNGRFVALRALEPYIGLDRTEKTGRVAGGKAFIRTTHRKGGGRAIVDHWVVRASGHAWSGGNAAGSYTDPAGPDASREMARFFLRHRTTGKRRSTPPA